MLKWVDDVAHNEYSNSKYYASSFKYILVTNSRDG